MANNSWDLSSDIGTNIYLDGGRKEACQDCQEAYEEPFLPPLQRCRSNRAMLCIRLGSRASKKDTRSLMEVSVQIRSASTDTKAIIICVLIPAGESQRVSTIEFDGGSRVRLLCQRYVSRNGLGGHTGKLGLKGAIYA